MTALDLAYRGPLAALSGATRRALMERAGGATPMLGSRVAAIIAEVRRDGDDALRRLASDLDGVSLPSLEVPRARWREALRALAPDVRGALEHAASNVAEVHAALRPVAQEIRTRDGVVVVRRPDALARVGVYAPGGRAAYPSSVLMGAVPARVAGVGEVILCSPPEVDGFPSALVLAAAEVAEVDRVFALGGAGAIAAMAYGTASVPPVARIVGPGNAYVAEAKAQLAGLVSIDAPAGPSELLVIADATADTAGVARELLAQAEHDPQAAVILVSLAPSLIDDVASELARLLAVAPRGVIARAAFAARGALISVESLQAAIDLTNDWAPEHLLLALPPEDEARAIARVRNAGTVFAGPGASVSFGDYLTGANHVLPTGGAARSYSGLSTPDFVRWTTIQRIDRAAAARLATDTSALASAEGLPAHADAASAWTTA